MASPVSGLHLKQAEVYLKGIGKQYGKDWAAHKSASATIGATPLTAADALGTVMSAERAPSSSNPQTLGSLGRFTFTISKPAKPAPQPQPQNITLHDLTHPKPTYAHVPGGSDAKDPYKRDAARMAGRKAAAAIDTYVIGNIPVIASIFGSILTTTIDSKRREAAARKLGRMGANPDPLKEAKYRSKLFVETSKDLEEALREVRLAIEYFENTAKAHTNDPSCDYVAHLFGFLTLCELRIEELDDLTNQIFFYLKALDDSIKQGRHRLQQLELLELARVLQDVMADHEDGSCGKHCVYDAGVLSKVSKPLPPTPPKV